MQYNNVYIDTLGYEKAPLIVTSDAIEDQLKSVYEKLKLPFGRLELMSGIIERRVYSKNTLPSDIAISAAKDALKKTSVSKDKMGALIMCSVCRDCLEPATSTIVHSQLDLPNDCMVFDISNACLGVLTGMIMLANMIELGQVESGMLVAGENSTFLLDSTINQILKDSSITRKTIKPLFASLTIGSGSIAVIMSNKKNTKFNHQLVAEATVSSTQHSHLCKGNEDKGMTDNQDTIMHTNSEELMHNGIQTALATWQKFQNESNWNANMIDCICTHQVGTAHKKMLCDELQLDIKKDFETLSRYGNMGSVSCPFSLAKAVDEGILKENETLVMFGIGSGINCTILGVNW